MYSLILHKNKDIFRKYICVFSGVSPKIVNFDQEDLVIIHFYMNTIFNVVNYLLA